ncbi:hypothetical protein [Paenibacillus sp. FSL L8-0708]|uniref:hypothetical protein n=1 Tax=Paenibacillus sp. FSL L8-0708 TaxID=2975311 RepID=UPI0030FAB523
MKRQQEKINTMLLILLFIVLAMNVWSGLETAKLNQRYETSVELHEKSTKEFISYLDDLKNQVRNRLDLQE